MTLNETVLTASGLTRENFADAPAVVAITQELVDMVTGKKPMNAARVTELKETLRALDSLYNYLPWREYEDDEGEGEDDEAPAQAVA